MGAGVVVALVVIAAISGGAVGLVVGLRGAADNGFRSPRAALTAARQRVDRYLAARRPAAATEPAPTARHRRVDA